MTIGASLPSVPPESGESESLLGDNRPNPRLNPLSGLQKSELRKTEAPMVLGTRRYTAPMQTACCNASQQFQACSAHFSLTFCNRFPNITRECVRPTGNVVAEDGSLLFTDDRNGVVDTPAIYSSHDQNASSRFAGPRALNLTRSSSGTPTPVRCRRSLTSSVNL